MITQGSALNLSPDVRATVQLVHLLGKLRVAGFKQEHMSLYHAMVNGAGGAVPRFCMPLAITSLSIPYLRPTSWAEADQHWRDSYV